MAVTSNGGTGARPDKDGLSATAYPSGVRGTPVEIAESQTPLIFWRKELRPDSGGAGRTQGGHGQIIEIGSGIDRPWDILAAFDRIDHPARGRDGGRDGAAGYVGLKSGQKMRGKGFQQVPPGDRLVVLTPGGGGIGAPEQRAPRERVARDCPKAAWCRSDECGMRFTVYGGLTPVKAADADDSDFNKTERTSMIHATEFMVGPATVLASTAISRRARIGGDQLDLATVWPDGNFHTTNAKAFAEEVGKATGGEVKITVQAGGSLGFKGPEQLRAVRDGLVPLADILNIQQIGDEPMLGAEVDSVSGRLRSES